MKIAYVHNIAMPGREANTVNVAKMCNAMAGLGHEVTLIAADGAPGGDLAPRLRRHYGLEHHFNAIALPPYAVRPSMAALAGALYAHRANADLVWTRAPHAALAACAAGMPTLLELHTDLSAFSALGRHAINSVMRHRNLAGVVVISDALGGYITEHFPHLRSRIIVAHDGADDRGAPPAPEKAAGAPLLVGYVGSLYPGKGVELVEAMAAQCIDQFTVVGGGGEKRTGGPNLHFRGAVAHAEVPDLLATFDVLVAPYLRTVIAADGRTDTARWMSPLKLFEYMAAKRPIVTSDLPVIGEILSDGETALLCDPDNLTEWAGAVARLRTDPSFRGALAARAYARFATNYTWRARAALVLDALAGIRSARNAPPPRGAAAVSAQADAPPPP